MKKLFFFILLCIFNYAGFSQENYYSSINRCDLYCELNSVRKVHEQEFQKHYISSCSFVKFTVDSLGNVQNIEFNTGTPDYIANFAKSGLLLTNGNWKPTVANGTTNKSFLLPIIYRFNVGKNIEGEGSTEYSTVTMNLLNMLQFGPDPSKKPHFTIPAETPPLDCVILKPYYLYYLN